MPLQYVIDPARRLTTITGEYAVADEWKTLRAAVADTEGLPVRTFSSMETALEWLAQE